MELTYHQFKCSWKRNKKGIPEVSLIMLCDRNPNKRKQCLNQSSPRVGEGKLMVRTLLSVKLPIIFSSAVEVQRSLWGSQVHTAPLTAYASSPLTDSQSVLCRQLPSIKPSDFKRMKKVIVFWSKKFDSEIYSWRELSRWLSLTPLIQPFRTIKSVSKTHDTLNRILVDKTMLREWGFLTILDDVLIICCCMTNYPQTLNL